MQDDKNILIVDDDESTCRIISLLLGQQGYKTETALTGREALNIVRNRFFDAALLDIKLPDMSGSELVGPFKEIHPDLVAIILTGNASMETAIQALNNGAVAYFTKPLNMDEIWATLKDALAKQHLEIENMRLLRQSQREVEERKRAEQYQKLAIDVLELLNKQGEKIDNIHDILF